MYFERGINGLSRVFEQSDDVVGKTTDEIGAVVVEYRKANALGIDNS